MGGRVIPSIFLLLGFLFFGNIATGFNGHLMDPQTLEDVMTQREIETEMATVPVINPSTPTTMTPIYNPNPTPTITPITNPDTTPTNPATNPYPTPATNPAMGTPIPPTPTMGNPATGTPPPSSSGQSWCVANPSASQTAFQVGLDYACGYGGADCSAIQQGGSCFNPDTVRDHASYAYNNYYQKNPVPTSCDFSGSAIITNTDPSTSTCQFPSSSSSSTSPTTTTPIGLSPPTTTSPIVSSPPTFGSSPPDFGSLSPPGLGSSPPDYTDSSSSSIWKPTYSFTLIYLLISLVYFKFNI